MCVSISLCVLSKVVDNTLHLRHSVKRFSNFVKQHNIQGLREVSDVGS